MEPLSEEERRAVLRKNRLGHIGLSRDGESYVLPIFYGYDGRAVFFHSHGGLKEDFIRATKDACLTVTEIRTVDDWHSVMVRGPVQKVNVADEIREAMEALLPVPLPPDWGFTETGEPKHHGAGAFFWKLTPREITGRKSRRSPTDEDVDMG